MKRWITKCGEGIYFILATLLIIACLIGLMAFAGKAFASTSFTSNLYYGVIHNDDVQALQEFLTEQGFYSGPITGNFYALTLQGVKKFQGANDLPTTGYFGVLSRGVANSILASLAPSPSKQETGTDSVQAQNDVVQGTSTPPTEDTPLPYGSVPIFVTPSGIIIDANGNVISVPQNQLPKPAAPVVVDTPAQSVSVSAPAPEPTPAPSAPTPPAPQPPSCNLGAIAAHWPQGSDHAQFSWTYTDGASAKIDTDLYYAAQSKGQITSSDSNNQQTVYGPSVFSGNVYTYTMTVTKDGLTSSCTKNFSL